MPRVAITPITPVGPYPGLPVTANSLDFTLTAADASDLNSVNIGTRALLVVQNTGAGARTFTVQSKADALNREGDIGAYSLAAGEFAAFILEPKGFRQADGLVWLDAEHAEVKFAVFHLPG